MNPLHVVVYLISISIGVAEFQTMNFLFKEYNNIKLEYSRIVKVGNVSKLQCSVRCARFGSSKCKFSEWTHNGKKDTEIGWCQVYLEEDNDAAVYEYSLLSQINQTIMVHNKKIEKINGEWSQWTAVGICSHSCNGGQQKHSRSCDDPEPNYGGLPCVGNNETHVSCNDFPCPVNGAWSSWNLNTDCTVTCGGGTQQRTRSCDNPSPEYGGNTCVGQATESVSCNEEYCEVNGGWSDWSQPTDCTESCGTGVQTKTRLCDNPAPAYGGEECDGNAEETMECTIQPCPIDGEWSSWSTIQVCPVTCGGGSISFQRLCNNPTAQFGGAECSGITEKSEQCNVEPCPASWGEWHDWNACSVTCMLGTRTRTRTCMLDGAPQPLSECEGDGTESQNCNLRSCGFLSFSSLGYKPLSQAHSSCQGQGLEMMKIDPDLADLTQIATLDYFQSFWILCTSTATNTVCDCPSNQHLTVKITTPQLTWNCILSTYNSRIVCG